jgi:hypothetical protein
MKDKINRHVLERRIMRHVYLTWVLRYIKRSRMVRLFGLVLLLIISRIWISFSDVFSNLEGISSFTQYFTVASKNTEFSVQIILAVATFIAVLFIVDFGKAFLRIIQSPHS